MGRRGSKRKGDGGDVAKETAVKKKAPTREKFVPSPAEPDLARALVAVDPCGNYLATACGCKVSLCSIRQGSSIELPEAEQGLPIRALAFDEQGKRLLIAGDNKACCVWDLEHRTLILKTVAPKKVSAACFIAGGKYVALADKFGEVYVAAVPQESPPCLDPSGIAEPSKPHDLLGHFSTIVTTLTAVPGKPWLVTTDREGKVRVNRLAKDPLQGPTCIQSFCLGHTSFITSLAALDCQGTPLLATGSGDGTVRLWNPVDGKELESFDTTPHLSQTLPAGGPPSATAQEEAMVEEQDTEMVDASTTLAAMEAGASGGAGPATVEPEEWAPGEQEGGGGAGHSEGESEDGEASGGDAGRGGEGLNYAKRRQELPPAAVALVASKDGKTLAVAVEGETQLLFLQMSADHRLSLRGRGAVPRVPLPISLALDPGGNLWAAGGCVGRLPLSLGCLPLQFTEGGQKDTPCTAELRAALGAERSEDGASGWAPGLQVSLELRRACYSFEEITRRKQKRMDVAAAAHC